MKYVEVTFSCIPAVDFVVDIVSAELAEIGFESFVTTDYGFIGYVSDFFFRKKNWII